jgi:hypothetical protein
MIKTRTSRVEDLAAYVKHNHPYEVPEVISVKVRLGNLIRSALTIVTDFPCSLFRLIRDFQDIYSGWLRQYPMHQ